MTAPFSPLFQPYTLNNGIVIKNRLVVAPMMHYGSHAVRRPSESGVAPTVRQGAGLRAIRFAANRLARLRAGGVGGIW